MKETNKKEFELDGKKVQELVGESQKRRLVFLDKKGEVIMSMVLLWAVVLSIVLWPLVVVAVIAVLATGGSVRIEK